MLYSIFVEPFSYAFMKKALAGCLCLSFSCGPVGLFLILRRMSLMGDALSHSVLPGAAIGYVLTGLNLKAMALGGIISSLLVALFSGLTSRYTKMKEDASFAGYFIMSVAIGVLIISTRHNAIDVMHILFGSALAVNTASLQLIAVFSSITLFVLAVTYRGLVLDCFDPDFFKQIGGRPNFYHSLFLLLVVLNLVAGFQALGTLLSLSIMLLPPLAARFWTERLLQTLILTVTFAVFSGWSGLLLSYHFNLPTGPCISLVAGVLYLTSLLFGSKGSVLHTIGTKK